MKQLTLLLAAGIFLYSCKGKEKPRDPDEGRIFLHTDTVNLVAMKDTMVISESTCRGCAMEGSTAFTIVDSLGVVKHLRTETFDGNSGDVAGGNVSKTVVLVPVKPGKTTFKFYKFWEGVPETITDSIPFKLYTVEVK